MKKIAILAVLTGILPVTGAVADCVQRELSWSAMKDSDEYLYQNKSDYEGKFAFECGKKYCAGRQMIFVKSGHYFDGKAVDENRIYSCKSTGDQQWVNYNVEDLSDCTAVQCSVTRSADKIKNYYIMDRHDGASGLAVDSGLQLLIQSETSVCKCKQIGTGASDATTSTESTKTQEEKSAVEAHKGPDCKSSRQTQNGKACCDLPSSAATYNATTDKCECKNGLEFEIKDGKGVCIMSQTITKCPDDMIASMQSLVRDANTKQEIRNLATQVLNMCNAPVPQMEEINNIIIIINSGIALLEASVDDGSDGNKTVVPAATVKSHDAIVTAINGIKNVAEELDISVWKNAEGKFNTARLASDSVAAVVLGTTGGVVTSTVMKKHQVEDGFEDINCSIGGQVVAGWGDEFRVGIQ